jgi:protoheme IX farnesyltransferase
VGALWVALAVLAGQCSVGWSNDAIDANRDVAVARSSKPVVAGLVSKRELINASLIAFALCAVLSMASGWRAALVHIVAVLSAIAYNARLKATLLSPLPYAVSFGLLPAFVTLGLPTHAWPQVIVMLATAAIGVGAHLVNAVADIDDDAATEVRGLPQVLGSRRSLEIGAALLLVAGLLVAQRSAHRELAYLLVGILGLVDVGVILAGATGRARAAWRLAMLAALVCLAIFVVGGGSLVSTR